MEQREDVFDRAYRFLVERTYAHMGKVPVGLKIIHIDDECENDIPEDQNNKETV